MNYITRKHFFNYDCNQVLKKNRMQVIFSSVTFFFISVLAFCLVVDYCNCEVTIRFYERAIRVEILSQIP